MGSGNGLHLADPEALAGVGAGLVQGLGGRDAGRKPLWREGCTHAGRSATD